MITVLFCRSSGPVAWLIRTFTMSHWNHVAIRMGGKIYHATGQDGVTVTDTDALAGNYSDIKGIHLYDLDEETMIRFARSHLGKPYDWGAVFGMFFRAGWHDPIKWFCSEYIAAILETGGKDMRLPDHRVTPRDLWVAL